MIWHPFTSQAEKWPPVKIARAEREFLYDSANRRYIDAIASWWTMIHGHRHPAIMAAIAEQLEKLDHVMLAGFTHEPAERVAAELLRLTAPDFSHVFYSDNGSTAVEVMLKLALQYWKNQGEDRQLFVHFDAAYHGDTFGAMSVAARSLFTQPFAPLLFQTHTWRYPQKADDDEFFTAWDRFLSEKGHTIAGVVIEPLIAAAGGMVFQESAALHRLCEAAERHGVLLLLDEVFTSMGRTGCFCAYQRAGVRADLVALAKGLTGGALPLAATLVSERIYRAFVSENPAHTFYHGHTMTGNPLGCAAALASLELLTAEGRLAQVAALEIHMRERWNSIARRHAGKIMNIRSLGAASAADLVGTKEKPGYTFAAGKILREQALHYGVVLRPLGNVLYLTPPYNITAQSLDEVFGVIDRLLSAYEP